MEHAAKDGNKMARLAETMYNYRIKKYIGSYAAVLNGVDVIVFTAGVGENQASMREGATDGLDYLGVKLDKELNKTVHGTETKISAPDSKVDVWVVPTDEEIVIARDTKHLLERLKNQPKVTRYTFRTKKTRHTWGTDSVPRVCLYS